MNCPHCQQPITPAQIASALANTAPKGKGARPGAHGLTRNPYGRKGKPCPSCGYTQADAQLHGDHHLCKNAGNAPWEK